MKAKARGFAGILLYGCGRLSVDFDALVHASKYSVSDPDNSWARPAFTLLTIISKSCLIIEISWAGGVNKLA